MENIRKKPPIDSDANHIENKKEIITGSIGGLISIAAVFLGLGFLWTGVKGKSPGNILVGLCITPVFLFQSVMLVRMVAALSGNISKRNQWIKNAIPVRVEIAGRKVEHNDYAAYEDDAWNCELTLRFPAKLAGHVEDWLVRASVSERIYGKHEFKDSVQVHCSPTDISTFLLDGE